MLEEAYEAVEAIDNKDSENLKEELGDVLLQTVFHSQLAGEKNDFDILDVINEECEKMIRYQRNKNKSKFYKFKIS